MMWDKPTMEGTEMKSKLKIAAVSLMVIAICGCENTNVDSHNVSDSHNNTNSQQQQQQQGQPQQQQQQQTTTPQQPEQPVTQASPTVTLRNNSSRADSVSFNGAPDNIPSGSFGAWTYNGSFTLVYDTGLGYTASVTQNDNANHSYTLVNGQQPGSVVITN